MLEDRPEARDPPAMPPWTLIGTLGQVRVARRAWGTAITCALVAAAASAPAAHASATQESIFMDDNQLLYRGDAVADRTLRELKALGVERVRVSVPWTAFAPGRDSDRRPAALTDPSNPDQYAATTFDSWDHLLRVARQEGIAVLFNVTGPAPRWAAGRLNGRFVGGLFRPSPAAFEQFVRMLGKRYDGNRADENQGGASLPRVGAWSIWNEPNQAGHLQPQWVQTRRKRWIPAAPRIYRDLVRAAGVALKATGHASDTVLIGETAPVGLHGRGRKTSMRPVPFLASLFCVRHSNLSPLRGREARDAGCDYARRGALLASGFAHHPYGVISAPDRPDPNQLNIRLADRDRLARLLDGAAAAKRVRRGLPFWYTEFGYQTNPPDPTPRGIGLDLQATWLAQAERISWADPRVAGLTQFLLRDDVPWDQFPEGDPQRWRTYQTGIEFSDGRPKPSYDAYRLPFVGPAQAPAGQPLRLWGMVRPGEGGHQVRIQFAPEGTTSFSDVGEPVTVSDPRGYFEIDVVPTASGSYRFAWTGPAPPAKNPTLVDTISGRKPAPPPVYNSVPVALRVAH
jgi:hypothetical protein